MLMSEVVHQTIHDDIDRVVIEAMDDKTIIAIKPRRHNILIILNGLVALIGFGFLTSFFAPLAVDGLAAFSQFQNAVYLVLCTALLGWAVLEVIWALLGSETLIATGQTVKQIKGLGALRFEHNFPTAAVRNAEWREGPLLRYVSKNKPISCIHFDFEGNRQEICKGVIEREAARILNALVVPRPWGRQ